MIVASTFLNQLANGVASGVIYSSLALAIVLSYRTTGLLNFAQGEMALFSTFLTYRLAATSGQGGFDLPIGWAIVASAVIAFVGGAVIERVLIRPVESSHSPLNVVIVTLGMFLAINAIAGLIFIKPGQEALKMPRVFPDGEVIGLRKETIGFAAVLLAQSAILWFLLNRTKIGLSLRAVASNPESSRLVGINTGLMLMVGWGLASAVGAIGGSLAASQLTGFDTSLMQQTLVFAFAAAALGGFDSLVGAVVGGMVVGIANAMTVQYVDALNGIELVVPFVLILLVLLVRPNGLFGRTIVERV